MKSVSGIVENRILPVEQQLNHQQEIIKKLASNLEALAASIQLKTGKALDIQLTTKSSTGSWPEGNSSENNPDIEENKIEVCPKDENEEPKELHSEVNT